MTQPAMVLIALRAQDESLLGFNVITLPDDGDPDKAGRELLSISSTPEGRQALSTEGFRQTPPQPRLGLRYKHLMIEAKEKDITHLYRLEEDYWEYQNTRTMYRGAPFHSDNLQDWVNAHQAKLRMTLRSPEHAARLLEQSQRTSPITETARFHINIPLNKLDVAQDLLVSMGVRLDLLTDMVHLPDHNRLYSVFTGQDGQYVADHLNNYLERTGAQQRITAPFDQMSHTTRRDLLELATLHTQWTTDYEPTVEQIDDDRLAAFLEDHTISMRHIT